MLVLIIGSRDLGQFGDLPALSWLYLLWLGAIGAAFVQVALAGAMKALSATLTASLITLVTPLSIVVAWLGIGERPTVNAVVGSCAVVGGVLLVSIRAGGRGELAGPAANAVATTGPS